MKKLICIVIVALGFSSAAFSQSKSSNPSFNSSNYTSGIGVRLGTAYYDIFSASFKTFLAETPGALELNLGFRPQTYHYGGNGYDVLYLSFAASYQYHFDIKPVPGFKWFIGGGISMYNAFVSDNSAYSSGFGLGLFPTGGVDYKFSTIPLDLSADLRPTFGLTRPNDAYDYFTVNFGVSARYTFK